jgi:hypothetical protein
MKRAVLLFVLAALPLAGGPSRAEEPADLKLVQGLREKHMPDLALQYLDLLKQRKLPPEIALVVPLEEAKARLGLALLTADAGQRTALQAQARAGFEAFLQAHPKHALAADASVALARMVSLDGKDFLNRARRQDTPAGRRAELVRARGQFERAGRQFEAAAALLDTQLARYAEPKTPQENAEKQTLTQARLQADFDVALNLLDQAQTYIDQKEFGQRGAVVKKAVGLLDKVANRDPRSSVGALARVWLGRCYDENDDPKAARKIYLDVLNDPGEHAEAARRLARYFRMRVLAHDVDPKNPLTSYAEIERQGDNWLAEYRPFVNTPEGMGVRYELANACLKLALDSTRVPSATRQRWFNKAQRLYQGLELPENEYSEESRQKKLSIILKTSAERTGGDISKLRDFEECHLRAQLEAAKLNQAEKELKGPKLEQQRAEHFKNMIQALTRALDLADAKVPAQDLAEARYQLAWAYSAREDYYRAVVLGEDLARTQPKSPRAPLAAGFALYGYGQLLSAELREQAGPEILDADRERLRKLAVYVEQTWPTDPAADVARHQLGVVLWTEKKYPEAVEALSRINAAGYANATSALHLLALACLQSQKADARPPKDKPPYSDRAIAALQAIPELVTGADAATTQSYMESRLLLGSLLYTARDYKRLQGIADALQKRLPAPELNLDEAARKELRPRVRALTLLAKYGEADTAFRAGQYGQAAAVLEPIINGLRNPAAAPDLAEIKDPGLIQSLVGLAMRANVQDNKIDRAKDLLELLQKSAPENSMDLLRDLVRQLSVQIQELRANGESAKEQLDNTVASFSVFLDELAKQKGPRPELLLFLAESYASLDKHSRAAELLARIPEPQSEGGKAPDPKKVQLYRAARILRVRELRHAREFTKAKADLDEILGTPEKPRWGQSFLDVRKERVFLLEDQNKFTGKDGAVAEWTQMVKQLRPRIEDARVKEQYFECYFHLTHSIYKYALTFADPARRQKEIQKAANFVVQLKVTQADMGGEASKKRFEELLQKEPPLRKACDEELRKRKKLEG